MTAASQRTTSITRLIEEAGSHLADVAKWPESETTLDMADNTLKVLRKAFKEDSYPRAFLWLAACQIAHDILSSTTNRDVRMSGLKLAWTKIGEHLLGDKEL